MALPIDPKKIDLNNREHVSCLIREIEGLENRERKRESWIDFNVYGGNLAHFVKERLKTIYPETHSKFRIGDISLSKKIVDKRAKAYKKRPMRELDTDQETIALNEIYDKGQFNRAFKEMDTIFNRDKYVAMWLSWVNPDENNEEGFYNLMALPPYQYDIIRDNRTGDPVIFALSFPDREIVGNIGQNDGMDQKIAESQADQGAEKKKYSIWNSQQHIQIVRQMPYRGVIEKDPKFDFMEIPGNSANVNPMGQVPVKFLSIEADTMDYPLRANLGRQSIEWGVSLSDLKTAAAAQGHGQLVISHPEGQTIKKKHVGMHVALDLPQSKKPDAPATTAQYINANPDLAGQLETLKFDAINILDEHGIKSKGGIEGGTEKFASGFDRLLSMADVQEIIEENQMLYEENIEQGIYELIQANERAMNKQTFRSENIQVTYEKPKPMSTDKEILEVIEKKKNLGVIEDWEALVILNPNLSEEQAKEKLKRINEAKKAKMQEFQNSLGAMQQNRPDEEEEKEEGEALEAGNE